MSREGRMAHHMAGEMATLVAGDNDSPAQCPIWLLFFGIKNRFHLVPVSCLQCRIFAEMHRLSFLLQSPPFVHYNNR